MADGLPEVAEDADIIGDMARLAVGAVDTLPPVLMIEPPALLRDDVLLLVA